MDYDVVIANGVLVGRRGREAGGRRDPRRDDRGGRPGLAASSRAAEVVDAQGRSSSPAALTSMSTSSSPSAGRSPATTGTPARARRLAAA